MTDPIYRSKEAGAGRLRFATALVAAAFWLTPTAHAADAASAMRVAKDPLTGAMRAATAEEAAALDNEGKSRRRAPRGLLTGKVNPASIQHPDGSVEQELDESSMSYMVATRNPDGTTSVACVTGPEAAAAALKVKKTSVKSAKEQDHDR